MRKQRSIRCISDYLADHVQFLKLADGYSHIPFRVVAFVDDAEKSVTYMQDKGVEPRSVFYPLHQQPCYQYLNYNDEPFEQSIACFKKGMCLPTWIGLTEEHIEYVSTALIESLSS